MTTQEKYAIGIDFGTESGRALLVNVATGEEVATAVHAYRHGVIDEALPESEVRLEPDWALQDPADYIETLKQAVPAVLRQAGIRREAVIGVGIAFTSCTMLPTLRDGTPLCSLPQWRSEPHAWVKLWKHHAAQPEADQINRLATERGEPWLARYGGKISSEWFFPKALQILNEAPAVYHAAERLLEGADWIVWQMTGREVRNSCSAGYKAIWSKAEGFPSAAYWGALHPQFAEVVDAKMQQNIVPIGQRAGTLTEQAAAWMGLRPGTPVAVGIVDAHASVPAATVTEPGRMVMIMGTSTCHMALSRAQQMVPGMCGVVDDGIIPGLFGYEAGQSAVGDIFAWFVEQGVPPEYHAAAQARGLSLHAYLEQEAAALRPGASGLLALDWWNGNRSVLVDVDLTGMLVGATLLTRAPEIYRALIEATAFGTRVIIEAFARHGVAIDELVATGGLPERNRLLMQIYADVTGREMKVTASKLAGALGAAMFGAVAAGRAGGGHDTIFAAAQTMARLKDESFRPNPAHKAVYDRLYAEYNRLHDYFGRGEATGGNDVMKRLKQLKAEAWAGR